MGPLIVVEKPDGSLRTCLDPEDLNMVIKREHYQIQTVDQLISKSAGAQYFTKFYPVVSGKYL